jgi:hypothetical protein
MGSGGRCREAATATASFFAIDLKSNGRRKGCHPDICINGYEPKR